MWGAESMADGMRGLVVLGVTTATGYRSFSRKCHLSESWSFTGGSLEFREPVYVY